MKKLLLVLAVVASGLLFSNKVLGQCGDGGSGTACANTSSGDAIIDVTNINSAPLNTWQTLSTTSTGQPRWRYTGVLPGTIIQFANCTGQDSELTISNPSGTVLQRDDDNQLNVGLGCTPNGNDESFSYYATENGSYLIRMTRHGSCANMNSGTKYLYWRVLYRPCSGVTPSYGSSTWNSYVYDERDLNYLYGSIGSTGNSAGFSYNWGTSQPITSGCGQMCDADNFSTRHMMNHNFTRAVYNFTYSSDDGIRISVDGGATWQVNLWDNTTHSGNITLLLDGSTNVIVDQREASGGANVSLSICQMAGSYTFGVNQWNAYVHDDMDVNIYQYQGTFTESNLGFCLNWGSGQPAMTGSRCGQTMDNDYYSVRFVRQENFVAGDYVVRVRTDDGVRVGINTGTSPSWNVINTWGTSTVDQTSSDIALSGLRYIYFDMRENTGSAQASINILKRPAAPSSITSSVGSTFCTSGQSVTLTANNPDGTVYWYTSSCGGTFIGTGNTITVNPTSTTTYYARGRNYQDVGCGNTLELFSNSCSSITLTLGGPAPTSPNAGSDVTICAGGSTNLSGSATAGSISSSSSVTYSLGNGSTEYNTGPSTATNSSCPIDLVANIPTGATITGVDVSYSMTSANSGWMSEQRSYLECTSSGGFKEASISSGSGTSVGTYIYNRTGLSIANGVSGGGNISFRLHSFRTWGGSGCNTTYNQVNNNTFTITVYYTYTPAISYSWTPTTGLSNPNIANPIATPTSTTTYTMTATSNGCSVSDDVTVTVDQLPTTAGPDQFSCLSPATIMAANNPAVGAGAWTWSGPGTVTYQGGTSASDYNAEILFSTSGSYTGTWTISNGVCSNTSDDVVIEVNNPDDVILGDATASCDVSINGWVHLYNSSGKILASINSNGQNLGEVNAEVFYNGGNARTVTATGSCTQNQAVMNRNFVINSTNAPTSAVSIRLYFTDDELAKLISLSLTSHTTYPSVSVSVSDANGCEDNDDVKNINEVYVTQISGSGSSEDGSFDPGVGTFLLHVPINSGTGDNNFGANYVQFDVSSFSEFWLHGSEHLTPLPVELLEFTAKAVDNTYIQLDWSTATEINNEGFVVERSTDAWNWNAIGWVPGNGNANVVINYTFADAEVNRGSTYYYRLKQIDYDGAFEYSPITSAALAAGNKILVYPNPASDNITVEIVSDESQMLDISLTNIVGVVVLHQKIALNKGYNTMQLDISSLSDGVYHLKVHDQAIKIIVAK